GGGETQAPRASERTVKSSRLRYSKLRTPVMRTRSPSMNARGITATSGRQGRSCEGLMLLNQTTPPKKSAANTAIFRGVRENHKAQAPNVRKTSANTRRSQPQGRLE